MKKFVYLLTVGCAVLVLQVAMVAAQAVPNMPPPGAPGGPPMGAPGGPPPAGGAPVAAPDLEAAESLPCLSPSVCLVASIRNLIAADLSRSAINKIFAGIPIFSIFVHSSLPGAP